MDTPTIKAPFHATASVRFVEDDAGACAVVVRLSDRQPRALPILRSLCRLGLQILGSKSTMLADGVDDCYYVRERDGTAVGSERQRGIEAEIAEAIEGTGIATESG